MKRKRLPDRHLDEGGRTLPDDNAKELKIAREPDTYVMTHQSFGQRLADGFRMLRKSGD
jgi:hypothetical protein